MLLLPLLWRVYGIARDRELMGAFASGRLVSLAALVTIAVLTICVGALATLTLL